MEHTKHYYKTADELTVGIEKLVTETDVVLDIGCGIAPINYFRPALHLMVEPWKEYAEILSYRHQQDKSVIILSQGALEVLKQLQSKSVDSIFLIDVIEHMDKEIGEAVIVEMERVARQQIVLFTPLGFMPQHIEHGEKDGWGLGGAEVQEHKSGWLPEDFSKDWEFHICESYHDKDYNGQPLEKVYGAFYAICNFENVNESIETPASFSEIRRPLPSEVELEVVKSHKADLEVEIGKLSKSLNKAHLELETIKSNWLYNILVKVKLL
ncbi:methyltransferase domain-containing protein [Enterovibrio nigricans]|uniref:Methyltransferase type 11 domain-containing protein n=1 Tax=Enterovibrio nigricans DSM 22720 TaxID=1121868 RepID=A0A1T4U811_9GAMM|nr:methyltransferase domain-containing protein [Enterovibrio nigricans]PKF51781.1 hypothetical protein AT251_01965 [Enterovibrio nigricans]SKA48769.1 hypothetical protein SAMN02745132_00983 [Enterovibrio nigricans DSM 22720]